MPCEGLSLLPLFKGKARQGHEALFWEFKGNRGIRDGNWKLCWDDRYVKRWELYDVAADRTEMHDRADERPELVQRLSAKWLAWAEATGAVNTVVNEGGALTGYNTDVGGFLEPLSAELAKTHYFRMARVLGTGGAARAIRMGAARGAKTG